MNGDYERELNDCKITPKGMLQIYLNQTVRTDVLRQVFSRTLSNKVNHNQED